LRVSKIVSRCFVETFFSRSMMTGPRCARF
jgi:hypothetical protein